MRVPARWQSSKISHMNPQAIERAVSAFSAANAEDPRHVEVDGQSRPFALVQAERRVAWLKKLVQDPPTALLLAAHCQHLRRWEIPRSKFEEGRVGYLKWRKALSKFHADQAAAILTDSGVESDVVDEVRRINLKQGLHTSGNTQTIEDVMCLVFLEYELEEFAKKHDSSKVESILAKTWEKMSETGRQAALKIDFSTQLAKLVERAISA